MLFWFWVFSHLTLFCFLFKKCVRLCVCVCGLDLRWAVSGARFEVCEGRVCGAGLHSALENHFHHLPLPIPPPTHASLGRLISSFSPIEAHPDTSEHYKSTLTAKTATQLCTATPFKQLFYDSPFYCRRTVCSVDLGWVGQSDLSDILWLVFCVVSLSCFYHVGVNMFWEDVGTDFSLRIILEVWRMWCLCQRGGVLLVRRMFQHVVSNYMRCYPLSRSLRGVKIFLLFFFF